MQKQLNRHRCRWGLSPSCGPEKPCIRLGSISTHGNGQIWGCPAGSVCCDVPSKMDHLILTVTSISPYLLLFWLPVCPTYIGRPPNDYCHCDVASMTSSTVESCRGHVTDGGVTSDVSNNIGDNKMQQSLLVGCIDDVASLCAPVSKNIKVFVCSTGTGYWTTDWLSHLLMTFACYLSLTNCHE